MNIAVVKYGDQWHVPCREWASVHMGREIKSLYRTKGNAIRAVQCPERNLLTEMCHRLEQMYTRLCYVENVVFKIKRILQTVDLDQDYDVQFFVWDCESTESNGSDAGAGNSSAGEGTGGTSARTGSSEEGS